MVRLTALPAAQAERYAGLECPSFDTTPWLDGPPLSERRVAIVASAGLVVRGEPPFRGHDADFRVIPSNTRPDQLLFSHISINLDRTGFQVADIAHTPLDRLRELAAALQAHQGLVVAQADVEVAIARRIDQPDRLLGLLDRTLQVAGEAVRHRLRGMAARQVGPVLHHLEALRRLGDQRHRPLMLADIQPALAAQQQDAGRAPAVVAALDASRDGPHPVAAGVRREELTGSLVDHPHPDPAERGGRVLRHARQRRDARRARRRHHPAQLRDGSAPVDDLQDAAQRRIGERHHRRRRQRQPEQR